MVEFKYAHGWQDHNADLYIPETNIQPKYESSVCDRTYWKDTNDGIEQGVPIVLGLLFF